MDLIILETAVGFLQRNKHEIDVQEAMENDERNDERKKNPAEILRTEFSEDFIKKMKARMVQSYFKYGTIAGTIGRVDHLEGARIRVERYRADGNTEWLVDAANMIMIEFMIPSHPNAHFKATNSSESPGRVQASNGQLTQRPNREIK